MNVHVPGQDVDVSRLISTLLARPSHTSCRAMHGSSLSSLGWLHLLSLGDTQHTSSWFDGHKLLY
jgi:hypothetical protein